MDNGNKARRSWIWMQEHMPGVVARLKAARTAGKGALIDECWRRGVIGLEPGWFYAYEGGVSVGVPAQDLLADPLVLQLREQFPGLSLLMLHGDLVEPVSEVPPAAEQATLNARQRQARSIVDLDERQRRYEESLNGAN